MTYHPRQLPLWGDTPGFFLQRLEHPEHTAFSDWAEWPLEWGARLCAS